MVDEIVTGEGASCMIHTLRVSRILCTCPHSFASVQRTAEPICMMRAARKGGDTCIRTVMHKASYSRPDLNPRGHFMMTGSRRLQTAYRLHQQQLVGHSPNAYMPTGRCSPRVKRMSCVSACISLVFVQGGTEPLLIIRMPKCACTAGLAYVSWRGLHGGPATALMITAGTVLCSVLSAVLATVPLWGLIASEVYQVDGARAREPECQGRKGQQGKGQRCHSLHSRAAEGSPGQRRVSGPMWAVREVVTYS